MQGWVEEEEGPSLEAYMPRGAGGRWWNIIEKRYISEATLSLRSGSHVLIVV